MIDNSLKVQNRAILLKRLYHSHFLMRASVSVRTYIHIYFVLSHVLRPA